MATKKAKKAPTGVRAKTVSFKDVSIAFMTFTNEAEGCEAVKKLNARPPTIKKAIEELKKIGKDGSALAALIPPPGTGPRAPLAGEARPFKAQQVGKNGPFIRLPLQALKAKKGDRLMATYDKDGKGVHVRLADADEKATRTKLRAVS